MRYILSLCLLIALCDPSHAAGHHAKSRQLNFRSSFAAVPGDVTPRGARIYRDDSVLGGIRTYHDDPPAYDDPSRFGGG